MSSSVVDVSEEDYPFPIIRQVIEANHVAAAMFVFLVVDYFETLPDEVKYVWPQDQPRRWSPLRILFFLTRYLAFVDVAVMVFQSHAWNVKPVIFGHLGCSIPAILFVYVTGTLGNALAEAIISIRIFALSKRSKWVAAWLVVQYLITQGLCLGFVIASSVVVITGGRNFDTSQSPPHPHDLPWDEASTTYVYDPPICAHLTYNSAVNATHFRLASGHERFNETARQIFNTVGEPRAIFIITLANQLLTTLLGFCFLFKNFRRGRGPLLTTLVQQGLLYFAVITVVDSICLANEINYWTFMEAGPAHGALSMIVQRSTRAALTSRIVIGIRRTALKDDYETRDSLTGLQFNRPQTTRNDVVTEEGKL